jgi:N-formylglutamate amidohydrolase
VVALNYPFSGGYIVRRYSAAAGQSGVAQAPLGLMIEVNRGLYVGNQTAATPVSPPNFERIADIRARLYRWANEFAAYL